MGTAAVGNRKVERSPAEHNGTHLGAIDQVIDSGTLGCEVGQLTADGHASVGADPGKHVAVEESCQRRQGVRIIAGVGLAINNGNGLSGRGRIAVIVAGHESQVEAGSLDRAGTGE